MSEIIDNEAFFKQMKDLLGEEYDEYISALSSERTRGVRANTLKISPEELSEKIPVGAKIPFEKNGFFIDGIKLGNSPYHHAGLFYLQEPSAMLPVAAIAPYLKGKILDLCAAPGGKSTQILNYMQDGSELICNEVVEARANILASNLERMGAACTVISMSPSSLENKYPEYFDAIVVDAPCSGEGMFRKEETAVRDWNLANVKTCAARQYEILKSAEKMLKPDGYIVYSTCTLNKVENEEVILKFLDEFPYMQPVEPDENVRKCTRRGFGLSETMRIFPHTFNGEGHFACLMKKHAETDTIKIKFLNPFSPIKAEKNEIERILRDMDVDLQMQDLGIFGDNVYIRPSDTGIPQGVRIFRGGLPIIQLKNGRGEPLHGLATYLKKGRCNKTVSFPAESKEIDAYLKGEAIQCDAPFGGYGVIAVDGYPLGLVKSNNGILKNHYPKGLRKR